MNILNTRWAMIAGLVIGGAATLIGCGSSSSPPPARAGPRAPAARRVRAARRRRGGANGGTGGATVVHKLSYTFDSGLQTWALSTFPEPAPRNNLAGIYTTDAGTDAAVDGGTGTGGPTLEFDSVVGSPAGSLKVTATFTAYGQYVDPVVNIDLPGLDLSGKIVHAKLQLTSGAFTGGAQLHISTGADFGAYGKGDFPQIVLGTWLNATIDLGTAMASNPPAVLNPAVVMQVGVQIFSSNGMPAGTPLTAPETVVFNIDTITD